MDHVYVALRWPTSRKMDHEYLAITLGNLGSAYRDLGDAARRRSCTSAPWRSRRQRTERTT